MPGILGKFNGTIAYLFPKTIYQSNEIDNYELQSGGIR